MFGRQLAAFSSQILTFKHDIISVFPNKMYHIVMIDIIIIAHYYYYY